MGDVDDKRRMISLAVKQLLHLSCLEFIALFLFRCSPTQLLIGVSLISNCLTEAVHEVHLSHNSITERGAPTWFIDRSFFKFIANTFGLLQLSMI